MRSGFLEWQAKRGDKRMGCEAACLPRTLMVLLGNDWDGLYEYLIENI